MALLLLSRHNLFGNRTVSTTTNGSRKHGHWLATVMVQPEPSGAMPTNTQVKILRRKHIAVATSGRSKYALYGGYMNISNNIKYFAKCIGNLNRIEAVLEKLNLTDARGYTNEYACEAVVYVEDFTNLPKVGEYEKHFDEDQGTFSMHCEVDGVKLQFRTQNAPTETCKIEWEETEQVIPAQVQKRRVAKISGCGAWTVK